MGSLFGEGLGGGASARLATSDTAHGRDFGLKGNINNNLMNAIRYVFCRLLTNNYVNYRL